MAAQYFTDRFNRVRAQSFVHFDQASVINTSVSNFQTFTDNVCIDVFHEIAQQWQTSVVVQVAAVLCSIRDSCVHFVQLLTCDCVSNQRSLVQRFVVSRFGDDARSSHSFECQLNTSFNHSYHQDAVVEEFLLGNFNVACWSLLEISLSSFCTPAQQILVIVCPVFHHHARESTVDDVILVLVVQRTHDYFQLFRQIKCFDLSWVRKTIQHVSHAAVFQCFSNGFPTKLDQFRCVTSVDAFLNHFVEAQD